MRFDFTDINKVQAQSRDPAEGLSVNSFKFDSIDGFTTLNVEGRDGFTRSLNAPELPKSGSRYLSSRIPARDLVVNAYLDAPDTATFNAAMDLIKRKLIPTEVAIQFNDQPDWHFIGTATGISIGTPGSLSTSLAIAFTCSDPYYHSSEKSVTSTNSLVINDKLLSTPVVPNSLTAVIGTTDGVFSVMLNDENALNLVTGVTEGDTIAFYFKELTVYGGPNSMLEYLSLESLLGDFMVTSGSQIKTSNAGTILTLNYEAVKL